MKRGFTLIELLVVVAIMGILGTISAVGYRNVQRGMEERGAMQNVNQFIRSAYQRAQIDRQPVAVFFWNELQKEETEFDPPVVVGKAVAVRRSGRFTYIQGSRLYDEFGDLRFSCPEEAMASSSSSSTPAPAKDSGVFLYAMNGNEGSSIRRTLVSQQTVHQKLNEPLLLGPDNGKDMPDFDCYAYEVLSGSGGNWSPKIGDAYGFEFAELELPHNFIFGSTYPTSLSNPVSGEDVLRFGVGANTGSGATGGISGKSSIAVSCIRPGAGGQISAQPVGSSDPPNRSMD